jgi:hypothetical protein
MWHNFANQQGTDFMGAISVTRRDLVEELKRVHRHIDQAIFDLTEAKTKLAANPLTNQSSLPEPSLAEMATTCISLELALADSVVWAQRLADKIRRASAVNAALHAPQMFCDQ